MRYIIIFLICAFSILGETVNFKVDNKFDFNFNSKERCLLDGKIGEDVYEIMINGKCSKNSFEGKIASCRTTKLIVKTENGITTHSGRGICK
jgi:hypothetical protein